MTLFVLGPLFPFPKFTYRVECVIDEYRYYPLIVVSGLRVHGPMDVAL